MDLHIDGFGDGEPAIFVHGTFGWGLDTFPDQRELADEYRVLLIDRRGYGQSPDATWLGWPRDMADLVELLDETGPAHLVGHSYGAIGALLAAAERSNMVLSLVAIEPPLFDSAPESPDATAIGDALRNVYERAPSLDARQFVDAWATAWGRSDDERRGWLHSLSEEDWKAVESSRRERWPGDAPIQFETLALAAFPKVVVLGAWPEDLAPGREQTRKRVFAAICDSIVGRIGARGVVFSRSCHYPQIEEAGQFNTFLREFWASTKPA